MSSEMVVVMVALLVAISLLPASPASSNNSPFHPPAIFCPGSREPVMLARPLGFCGEIAGGLSCCDDARDAALEEEFHSIDATSNPACATIVKRFLCETCVPSPSPGTFDNITGGALAPQLCGAPPSPIATHHHGGPTLCVEMIGEGTFHGVKAHPDGSERIFLWNQNGRVWLSPMPKAGSGGTLRTTTDDNLFVDVKPDLGLQFCGLVDVAFHFHSELNTSARMFITYRRRAATSLACGCSNATTNCDLVVAEVLVATGADPSRRFLTIFSTELQQPRFASYCSDEYRQQGGQMLFPHNDNYLYLVTGNGHVLRFDVGRGVPAAGGLVPEIVAAGGFSPMGCGVDYDHSNLLCANVDEDLNEQVCAISYSNSAAGENHQGSSAAAVVTPVIRHGRIAGGADVPSIAGGVYCNVPTDTSSKKMRFLYAYRSHPWIAEEIGKGRYTTVQIANVACSTNSPLPCTPGVLLRDRSCSYYFGSDNNANAVILNANSVLRVVSPGHCAPAPAGAGDGDLIWQVLVGAFSLVIAFCSIYRAFFAPGGEQGQNTWWCFSRVTQNTINNGNIDMSSVPVSST